MLGNVRRKEWGVRPLGSPTASASTLALSLFVRTRRLEHGCAHARKPRKSSSQLLPTPNPPIGEGGVGAVRMTRRLPVFADWLAYHELLGARSHGRRVVRSGELDTQAGLDVLTVTVQGSIRMPGGLTPNERPTADSARSRGSHSAASAIWCNMLCRAWPNPQNACWAASPWIL